MKRGCERALLGFIHGKEWEMYNIQKISNELLHYLERMRR